MTIEFEGNPASNEEAIEIGEKAYMLLRTEPYDTFEVIERLKEIPQVTSPNICLGEWNITAIIRTETTRELGEVYHGQVQKIKKIVDIDLLTVIR